MKLPCQRRQRRVRQRRRLHQGTDEGLQFGVGALGVWCFALSTVLGSSVWHRPDEPRGPSSPPQASWPLRIRPVSVECALALRGSWPSPANVMPPNREYEPGTTPKWHKLLPVKANTVSTCFVGIHAESSPFQRSQRYAQNYRNNQTIFLVGVTCDSEVILAPGTQKTICDTVASCPSCSDSSTWSVKNSHGGPYRAMGMPRRMPEPPVADFGITGYISANGLHRDRCDSRTGYKPNIDIPQLRLQHNRPRKLAPCPV